MTSTITLDGQTFWVPQAAANSGDVRQTKQRQPMPPRSLTQQWPPSTFTSLRQTLSLGAEAGLNHVPVVCGRPLDGPITIPSDTESEADDADDQVGGEDGGRDGQDIDDSRSLETLPSANAVVTSIAKAQPGSTNGAGKFLHTLLPMSREVDEWARMPQHDV